MAANGMPIVSMFPPDYSFRASRKNGLPFVE